MKKILLIMTSCVALFASELIVKPISKVTQKNPPTFTQVTSSDAVLEFISSVPLNCMIVYGETTKYGNLTNDPNMSSPLTINHKPILSKLKPNTLYHARVQGLDANGVVYVGQDMTFRTKLKQQGTLKNIALLSNGSKVLHVSSNWGGGKNNSSYGANSAIDGSRSSAWSSASDGDNASIEIGFPKSVKTSYIKVWTRTMSNNTAQIFSFNITNDKGEVFGPFDLPDASKAYKFELKTQTKSLKMKAIKTNTGNTGLVEFEVY